MDDDVHLATHAILPFIPSLPRDGAVHEVVILEVGLEWSDERVTHSVMAPAASRTEGIEVERMERGLLRISGVAQHAEGPVAWVAHWIDQKAKPRRLNKLRWYIAKAAICAPMPQEPGPRALVRAGHEPGRMMVSPLT
jgi:hypothetical protein